MRVIVCERGSAQGADYFLVLDATGREASVVTADPSGSVHSWMLGNAERPEWRRSFERDLRIGAAFLLEG